MDTGNSTGILREMPLPAPVLIANIGQLSIGENGANLRQILLREGETVDCVEIV